MTPDTTDLLSTTPALLPELLVEHAERLTGGPAALYVVDIGGTTLVRIAGAAGLPAELPIISGVGPELGRDGEAELEARLVALIPGAIVAPLWLRERATAALVSSGGEASDLARLAVVAAPAVELAAGYTDVFERARRLRPASAAAEVQQDLLAPRMARVTGAEVCGSLLPAYDVGGDWFDHTENPEGAWLGVADSIGRGTTAAAISAVAMGAVRAKRRAGASIEECCAEVDHTIGGLDARAFVTAVLATWHAPTSTFSWVNCGHPPPLLLRAGGEIVELEGEATRPLGLWPDEPRVFLRNERTLERGDRVLLYSDGLTDRRLPDGGFVGFEGLVAFLGELAGASAAQTVFRIEHHIRGVSEAELADDATQLVLAVTG